VQQVQHLPHQAKDHNLSGKGQTITRQDNFIIGNLIEIFGRTR
jgi:hypothetical protein